MTTTGLIDERGQSYGDVFSAFLLQKTRCTRAMLSLSAAKILTIDDDPKVVDSLVTCLRDEGYEVFGALTSDEGLRLSLLWRPDLILLEIALRGMNGLEVFKRIRSIDPRVRVIVVTGNTDAQLAREALQVGALAYVDKPFDLAYLKRVVAIALRERV